MVEKIALVVTDLDCVMTVFHVLAVAVWDADPSRSNSVPTAAVVWIGQHIQAVSIESGISGAMKPRK